MAPSAVFRISGPKVVHEVFDDEVVIINLDTGTYYSVEGVAAEIWTRIDGTAVTEILDDLTARYRGTGDQEIAPAVMRFVDEFRSEGLIVPAEAHGNTTASAHPPVRLEAADGQFQAPVLRKFDDMQELLLLDPIHDFDDAGWPIAKPARAVEK